MANCCAYKVLVCGKKNACYAFFGSMSSMDSKSIVEEHGSDSNYTLRFEGNCKWSVDSYCTPWSGDIPVELPDNAVEAQQVAETKYLYNTVQERSKMFEVEVFCNSADIEDFLGEIFEHYINGQDKGGECPEELRIIVEQEDVEEGFCKCVVCGGIFPEEDCIVIDEGIAFCQDCHEVTFG